tara:strand:- start:17877 stop:18335 length:459 start_codon:yes stop_codon:yes gene_type:complete
MPVVISGKLKDKAREFQAGESTGFGIRLGEKVYNKETQENEWTNYDIAVFARAPKQVDFYRKALCEGAVVQITGETQRPKSFTGGDGRVHLSIDVQGCKLANVFYDESAAPAQAAPAYKAPAADPGAYKPAAPQEGYMPAPAVDSFDDDIPF